MRRTNQSGLIALGAVALLFCSICLYAQEARFGVKAGLNLANIYGKDSDGSMNAGLVIGALVKFPVSEKFALQPELLYSQQGTQGKEGNVTLNFNNNYLNLPVMGKMYVAPNFNFQVGPQLGFLLNSKLESKVGGADMSVDSKELYKTVDIGINAGLEYESEMGLSVTARYNLGLTNVVNEQVVNVQEVSSKNSVIQITFGYLF